MGQNTIDFVSKMGQKERIYNQLIYKLDDLPCTNSNRTS